MAWSQDKSIANMMRRMHGQICTPPGFSGTDEYAEIKRRKLMVFHEWPSGHWDYTDKGRYFLMYQNEEKED